MDVIWQQHNQVSVREILTLAYPDGEKAYTTVQTVMNHLVQKGYLIKTKIGLVNFYKTIHKKEEIVKNETKGFVKKVYNGSFKALASYIVDSDSLTIEEINELKKLIVSKEKNKG